MFTEAEKLRLKATALGALMLALSDFSVSATPPGTVVEWGSVCCGATPIPPGLSNVVEIAAGWVHTVALKNDGTVVAWGDNSFGATNVPPGLSNVAAIAGSWHFSMALKRDGTVVAWGFNDYGQTNVPAGLSNVIAITAGLYHAVVLQNNGTVLSWGFNELGQTNVPPGLSNVLSIAAGGQESAVLNNDGTVVGWGAGADGVVTNRGAGLSNIVAISIGNGHAMALRNDGRVVPWGSVNSIGTANVPSSLSNVVAIAAGGYFALALKQDGKVVAWGGNSFGQTNVPPSLSNVVAIAGGGTYSAAIVSYPARVIIQPADVAVNAGSNTSFAVTGAGTQPLSYQWRQNGLNLNGATNAALALTNVQPENIGGYSVVITNISGSTTSRVAALSIFYSLGQYLANREAGRADVISAPNAYGLFTTNQVQEMNVSTPLLKKDAVTGNFKLTVRVQKTPNLAMPFVPFPMSSNSAKINAEGELEFVFPSQDDAAFFRLQSR